jgi:DinB family protein
MTTRTIDPSDATCTRVLAEGYGPGAWHGPDLKAALADVSADTALWRPASGRHNIAEIALHHAYCVRNVVAKVTGVDPGAFVVDGDDWFEVSDGSRLSWSTIRDVVDREQQRLTAADSDIANGRIASPLSVPERFNLVLGITCHAVYHAGQVQLIKRLRGE